ncbi:MAG: hypothetical protein HYV90_02400 [Candidatus Woesebacteria bacterium]|nr:MAG: hypothetical protein HYV90_02400 [Candidatus Woesebacteria bacterium]
MIRVHLVVARQEGDPNGKLTEVFEIELPAIPTQGNYIVLPKKVGYASSARVDEIRFVANDPVVHIHTLI